MTKNFTPERIYMSNEDETLPSGESNSPWLPIKVECWHKWERYVGFKEVYDYCIKCDLKREAQDDTEKKNI